MVYDATKKKSRTPKSQPQIDETMAFDDDDSSLKMGYQQVFGTY